MTDVERQYARAVFSLALENNEVDEMYLELNSFLKSLEHDSWQFFLHPRIKKEDKQEVLNNTLKNKLVINFLKVLIDNDRFELIEGIAEAINELMLDMHEIIEVHVIANAKISESNIKKIKNNLEPKLLKKVKIIEEIDSSIIGGIKIEYQGNVIDQTINASLDALKHSLTGGN